MRLRRARLGASGGEACVGEIDIGRMPHAAGMGESASDRRRSREMTALFGARLEGRGHEYGM